MSIPPALMPGGPQMGGGAPGAPGAGAGAPGGGGGLESLMALLGPMQQTPPQSGEDNMFRDASAAVGQVYARVAPRSAKAAARLSKCLTEINLARQDLQQEGDRPLPAPPNLGMGGGMPAPTMPMPGF